MSRVANGKLSHHLQLHLRKVEPEGVLVGLAAGLGHEGAGGVAAEGGVQGGLDDVAVLGAGLK